MEQKDFEKYYENAFNSLVKAENYFKELLKDLLVMWYNTEKKETEILVVDCVLVGIYGELYNVKHIVFAPISGIALNGYEAFNHFYCKADGDRKLTIEECISQNPYNSMKLCRAVTSALINNGAFKQNN